MGLPLYVICIFCLTDFSIVTLFNMLVVLAMMCHEEVLFWSSLFGILEASRFGKFSVIVFLHVPFGLHLFSFFNAHDSQVWSFDEVTEILHIFHSS
jgi:hypothetical protein